MKNRGLLFALAVVVSVLVADVSGQLMAALGANLRDSVSTGAGAFVITLGIAMAVIHFFVPSPAKE